MLFFIVALNLSSTRHRPQHLIRRSNCPRHLVGGGHKISAVTLSASADRSELCGLQPVDFLTIHSAVSSSISGTSASKAVDQKLSTDLECLYGARDADGKFKDSPIAAAREPEIVRRLRERTLMNYKAELSSMMMPASQTGFLWRLAREMGAKRVFEVGTFTGMGALVFAIAGEGVTVVTCDVGLEAWEKVGKRVVGGTGIDGRIEVVEGRGLDVMHSFLCKEGVGTWDCVFVDGDKEDYAACFDLGVRMVKRGGLVIVDDVLWSGRAESLKKDNETRAIKRCIDYAFADSRMESSIAYVGDGLLIAMKKVTFMKTVSGFQHMQRL